MMTMTFHELYGELPKALLRAYRKYNVSPADHDMVMHHVRTVHGTDNWSEALDFVERHSTEGYFRVSFYS